MPLLIRPLSLFLLLLFVCAGICCPSVSEAALTVSPVQEGSVASIPDSNGRAGMAAGIVNDEDGSPVIIAAGGANFPDGLPWEGGKKIFYKDILRFKNGEWEKTGELPEEVAYPAFAGTPGGLIIAGGVNERGHLKSSYIVNAQGKITRLPDLPVSSAYPAFAFRNNRLYLIGGQENPDSTSSLKCVYMLDVSSLQPGNDGHITWKKLPDLPGEGRILATAGIDGSRIFVFGGVSLSDNGQGEAVRTYLKDVFVFDSVGELWMEKKPSDLPYPLAAPPSPAPAREGMLLLPGGDTGSHYGQSPQTHPGQSGEILLYDTLSDQWTTAGSISPGIATAPTVTLGKTVYIISGETSPGIRTPLVSEIKLDYALELNWVDYLVFVLLIMVIVLILYQIRKNGVKNIPILSDANSRPGRYAWVVVGLLWVVAMLNYFDRQLLTAIREPVIRDIPQTEMQFGMLTGIFLLIYSLLSPVGGFLADKYSRRVVILCSLVVWSTVTWITGHVHDYNTLLAARALMGISEACYIPAALALITDYHRGKTRSLATGIHMSGIYAGMAFAGLGGDLADASGWRFTFALFGLIGVAYAMVLVVFLKEQGKGEELHITDNDLPVTAVVKDSPGILSVFKTLVTNRKLLILMGVVAAAGAANWFLLAWFPTLLQEKFNLTLGDAGKNATFWSTMAKYVAVLAGAIIADQWSARNARGRSLLPGIVFCIAGPLIVLSPFIPAEMSGAFVLLLLFVASQGLAQGTLDATLMPIMRSHIGGKFAATGYGFLNLVSAGFGAFTVIYGGRLKDMGISLDTTLAYTGGLLLLGGILLFLLPKPNENA